METYINDIGRGGRHIDISTFESWMGRIMERLDQHEDILCAITGKKRKETKYWKGERLYDTSEVCKLLSASKRTVQRYRSDGKLPYRLLEHRTYYTQKDIQTFIDSNLCVIANEKKKPKGK